MPDYYKTIERFDRKLLTQALKRFHGNRTKAARYLKLNRPTFVAKIQRLGIDQPSDKKLTPLYPV